MKVKTFFHKLSEKFFYSKYKNQLINYGNKKIKFSDYIFKVITIFIIVFISLTLIFPNIFYCIFIALVVTIFIINRIILNAKKIEYQYFILSQLTIYVSQVSLFIDYNNVYSSLKETINFLSYPIKDDLEKVIKNIESGLSISDSFLEFNEKYNNKTITLFNQSLELFDDFGSSNSSNVLHVISEELNDLKIKKDRFHRFKKEWRLNFYVVTFMCLSMPILLKLTIPDVYLSFMNSFGSIVMVIIFIINLFIIAKIEEVYSDLSIGEDGYR